MGRFVDKLQNIKLVKTLTNIWRIEDLRSRILITLLFVAIYRFGSYVVLPGIDTEALQGLRTQTEGGLMSLLDMFSGGAFSKASIFARNHALHLRIHRDAVVGYRRSILPEDAA